MPNKRQRQRKRRKAQQEQFKNKRARKPKPFWIQQQVKLQQLAAEEGDDKASTNQDFEVNIILSTAYLTDDYRTNPSDVKQAESLITVSESESTNKKAAAAFAEPDSRSNLPAEENLEQSQPWKKEIQEIEENEKDELPRPVEAKEVASAAEVPKSNEVPACEERKAQDETNTDADAATASISNSDETHHRDEAEPRIHISPHPSCLLKEIPGKPPIFVKDLPNGDCGDGIVNPHDKSQVADKYWAQRRRLFTKFDQGIQLDTEGWFSVTPEAIANHIALRLTTPSAKSNKSELIILDAFVGVGGNAIALALRPEVSLVVCVDTNQERLLMAAANARIYGIPTSKMVFIHGDACDVLRRFRGGKKLEKHESKTAVQLRPINGETVVSDFGGPISVEKIGSIEKAVRDHPKSGDTRSPSYPIGGLELLPIRLDGVFLSPPWGGSDYESIGPSHYDLSCIQLSNGMDGNQLLTLGATASGGLLAYFLPRNINGFLLAQAAYASSAKLSRIELEQNYLNRKLKTVTLYAMDSVQE